MAQEPRLPSGWVDEAWDGAESRWDNAAEYADACLINLNTGPRDQWTKGMAMLPYKEPGGKINVRGVLACAGGRGLMRVQRPDRVPQAKWAEAKRAAARKLIRLYGQMGRQAPDAIYQAAGMKMPQS
jgi:hypothetical protein